MKFKVPVLEFDLFNYSDFEHIGIDYFQKAVIFNLNIVDVLKNAEFYQKIQLFIGEVLSNYLKFSEAKILKFKLEFYDNYFIVNIYSEGKGFEIKEFKSQMTYLPPYPNEIIGKDIVISCIDNLVVCAHVKNENEITFKKENLNDTIVNIDLDDLQEKYGIIMITNICQKVFYIRKPNNLNLFKYYIRY